jgi:PAS domain S-box-containing protein
MPTSNRKLKMLEAPAATAPSTQGSGKYRALFDHASDAILTVTTDGRIDDANCAFEEMTGYLKAEVVGHPSAQLVPPSRITEGGAQQKRLETRFFAAEGTYEDVAILRQDGYVRFVDMSVRLIDGLAIAIFRDVTERKRMERELITKHTELRDAYFQLEKKNAEMTSMQETLVQSGKMAALGELAAGIAHELNQPLLGIRGYAQELRDTLVNPDDIAKSSLKEIISNADKMAGIIKYLREFTRKSTENFEHADVHHAVEEALKMLKRQFESRGISVSRDYAAAAPKVYANPLQLEQVFINLAANARDAIEATGRGSGSLRIATRTVKGFVEVSFRDDGCGMTEKNKAKAFNPFFTTKEVGKGMGLGLSLSYGILSKLQGSIVVESEIGKGAEFVVRIPVDFRELA